jgi:acetylornithine deacetylase
MAQKKLTDVAQGLYEEAVESLQKAVQIEIVTGNENQVQGFVEELLNAEGLKTHVWQPTKKELEKFPCHRGVNLENLGTRKNVVGVLPGSGGGRSLILNGHVDTVSAFDPVAWTEDPWSGKIQDGKLYGRGACDMKSGLMAAIYAIKAVRKAGLPLRGDVIVESVIGEENGGAGTLACMERGYKADAAVIMEPTRNIVIFKQCGVLYYKLTLKGKPAHASASYEGVDVIAKAGWLHRQLMDWTLERTNFQDDDFEGYPVKAPHVWGKLTAGEWGSSVPETAVVEGRFGCLLKEDEVGGQKVLADKIGELCRQDEWLREHPPLIEWSGIVWPSYELPRDDAFIGTVLKSCGEAGLTTKLGGVPYGTDAKFLYPVQGISTVVFGPGNIKQAHFPNEFVSLAQYKEAIAAIAHIIADWCA